MIRQRKPNKRADITVLTLFVVRQAIGLAAIGTITYFAFQIPDHKLAWVMLPFFLLYAGYSSWVLIQARTKYRQRYGRKP